MCFPCPLEWSVESKSDLLPMEEVRTPAPAALVEADTTAAAEIPAPSVVPNPTAAHANQKVETTSERLEEEGTLKLD